jgi:hypothetical protein
MNRIYICLLCNDRHQLEIDAIGHNLIANFKECKCGCPRAILNNLEYLEYKYEQTTH